MMLSPAKLKIEFEKPKRFFFHFNKPLSQQKGIPMISIHVDGVCYAVKNVICQLKTQGKINKRQPRFVMVGKLSTFEIVDNIATLK